MSVVVIVGIDDGMLQARGEGYFLGAVQSQTRGVDAGGGDVAAQGSRGIAHGHAAARAFIIGLCVEDGIVDALSAKHGTGQQRDE